MSSRLERNSAFAGLAAVGLWIAGLFTTVDSQPGDHATDQQILTWAQTHADRILLGNWMFMVGCLCFVWFAGVFSRWSPAGPAVLVSAAAMAALYSVALGAWESLGENFKDVAVADVSAYDPGSSITSRHIPSPSWNRARTNMCRWNSAIMRW